MKKVYGNILLYKQESDINIGEGIGEVFVSFVYNVPYLCHMRRHVEAARMYVHMVLY